MLISTWVVLPRSVMNTGSIRAARLAWLTSWLKSRLEMTFTCLCTYIDKVVL